MSFIPYHSPKGTADLTVADAEWREAMEKSLDHLRHITVRWVPVLQEIARQRPEMHWCSYDDGRVVAFTSLNSDETFGDLEPLYEFISAHTKRLATQGYKGEFLTDPDPEDDTGIKWREWRFKAGDSDFVLNASFHMSQHCKLVSDGFETVEVEKKRVVCGDEVEQAA